jgi:murein L,D-transpeptidase YafK
VKCLLAIVIVFIAALGIALRFLGSQTHPHQPASKVLVLKAEHRLLLLDDGNDAIHTYSVAIGRGGVEIKQRQGEQKTPEGLHTIDRHKKDRWFRRALHISYSNDADQKHARKLHVDPGADIMIHGIQNGVGRLGRLHRAVDWTEGCIALTDAEIEEIYSAVSDGTPIEIRR